MPERFSPYFVNGFCYPSKILDDGDRIRICSSVFVYLQRAQAEVDPAELQLTAAEENWDRDAHLRDSSYEPAKAVVIEALLKIHSSLQMIRDPEQIQSRVLDLIFQVIPVERAALQLTGHDQGRIVSTIYRQRQRPDEPFEIDPGITQKVLREGAPIRQERLVCYPMKTFDAVVGLIYAVMGAHGEYFTGGHMNLLESIAPFTAVALEHARHTAWLEGENRRLNECISVEHGMIGRSEALSKVQQVIGRAGPSGRTVLITGESGTGKELVAQAIHRNSERAGKAYHAVNCGAFTDSLLGSELFGHERSAFTGAQARRLGLFESANGGTVFLDEIGECSMPMQADLLRVLQSGEFKRQGGNEAIRVDVRVIAATNLDLQKAIREGRFRQDLFYRLNVIRIQMPRLAERREDIPLLAAHFIKKYGYTRSSVSPPVQGMTPEAHRLLASYDWPGNVRELENTIQRAIALGTSPYLSPEDLDITTPSNDRDGDEIDVEEELKAFKTALYERVLIKTKGNRKEAARICNAHPTYFAAVCKELNVKAPGK